MFLSRNIFSRARLQLVTMYAIIFLVMVTIADIIIGYNRTQVLKEVIQKVVNDPAIDSNILAAREDALSDLLLWKYSLFLLLCLVVSSIAYILANRSLKPITEVVESQRRFISNASHELRTPLSIMKTQAEVALRMKDKLSKEEIETALSTILSEVGRISETIDTLLQISNNLQVTKKVSLSRIAVRPCIEKALQVVMPMSASKSVNLEFICKEDSFIEGNAVALEGIIMNLLRNAITYTHSTGKVNILLDRNKNKCHIVIQDTGIGIPQKDIQHIFSPFFRSDEAKQLNKAGSGLGLTLVKELVEAQKGSILITSMPKKGTEVTLAFPLYR